MALAHELIAVQVFANSIKFNLPLREQSSSLHLIADAYFAMLHVLRVKELQLEAVWACGCAYIRRFLLKALLVLLVVVASDASLQLPCFL